MPGEFVHPKLAPPTIEGACERSRLYEAIDRARVRPVVWVSGPAGSGKSTLVSGYCRARKLNWVWYDVDERDRDVATLFYYLGLAAEAQESKPPLPILAADHPLGSLAFARRYFESFFERIDRPALVVFDNCHVVAPDERWYELLKEGALCVPPGLNLVFISRAAPAPVFARLLASSRVSLLGWDELRFSRHETRELIEQRAGALGKATSSDAVDELYELSNGWAAGIVLGLECSRGEGIKRASGVQASPHFFDYFATEVLSHAEPRLRKLLIASALLPNMTAQALDSLLGVADGARLLARLKNDNFFVSEHAASPTVYRYHPLFREFLLSQARSSLTEEELQRLHRAAAPLLADQGEITAALDLFAIAGDHGAQAALIAAEAPKLIQQGRTQTLAQSLERLPDDVVAESSWLSLWAGIANLGTDPGSSKRRLGAALESFDRQNDLDGYFTTWCARVQACLLEGNDYRELVPLLEQAIELHERGGGTTLPGLDRRVLRTLALGALLRAPQDPKYAPWIERALMLPRGRDIEELGLAVMTYGWRGELTEFRAVIDVWRRRAARESLGSVAELSLCVAEVVSALFSGDFEACDELVRKGLELVERSGVFPLSTTLRVYYAYQKLALGDLGGLALIIDDMAQDAESGRIHLTNYHFVSCYEALLLGDIGRARGHVQIAVDEARRLDAAAAECVHGIGLAEVLWQSNEIKQAREELERMKPLAQSLSAIMLQGATLIEAAITLSEDEKRGDELLAEALALGEKQRFVSLPWPIRTTLAGLYRRAERRGIQTDYVRELTRKLALRDVESAPPRAAEMRSSGAGRGSPPAEFSKAVRQALRRFHEAGRLAQNPLVSSELVRERAGAHATVQAQVEEIQVLLRESAATLAKNSRTDAAYRALFHTYLEPAATQLLAAEAAKMSFGTYRRQLAAGLDEVTAALWLREQALNRGSR